MAWMIEPRDPLVVRDGRPNQGRSESVARTFPLPSTLAGAVRTRLGLGSDGVFAKTSELELAALRSVSIRGPLLVEADGGTFYVPTPADMVVLGGSGAAQIGALVPEEQNDALLDEAMADLWPTVLRGQGGGGKPVEGPAFVAWPDLTQWLVSPGPRNGPNAARILDGGIDELPCETRMHVQVGAFGTAEDGMLFEIDGLRFVQMRGGRPVPLSLWVDVDDSATRIGKLRAGLAPLGGKRRLVRWSRSSVSFPAVPRALLDAVCKEERSLVRVVLLTPAIFEQGYRPAVTEGTPLGAGNGVTRARLVAACVGRPIAVSGWDMAKRQPKRTRRAAPAGSVYWVELEGSGEARAAWVSRVWGHSVSEDLQDRRDGFGLAVVGLGGDAA